MAWHLFNVEPLPQPMLTYFGAFSEETSVNYIGNTKHYQKNGSEKFVCKISAISFRPECGIAHVYWKRRNLFHSVASLPNQKTKKSLDTFVSITHPYTVKENICTFKQENLTLFSAVYNKYFSSIIRLITAYGMFYITFQLYSESPITAFILSTSFDVVMI